MAWDVGTLFFTTRCELPSLDEAMAKVNEYIKETDEHPAWKAQSTWNEHCTSFGPSHERNEMKREVNVTWNDSGVCVSARIYSYGACYPCPEALKPYARDFLY